MIKKEQSLIESQIFPARELFFPMLQKIKTKFFSSSFISIHIDVTIKILVIELAQYCTNFCTSLLLQKLNVHDTRNND